MADKRIKDISTSITAFRTGDVIPVDGPSGTAKMSKDDLLKETAENALAEVENLPVVFASYSKNLFNKDTPNKKTPCVVYYASGTAYFSPDTFSAVVVPIPDGVTQISVNSPDAQIAAFDRVVDVTAVSSGDAIAGYLGGSTQQTNVGFTLPANTKCVVVSCYTESLIYLQVESGNVVTAYEPYVCGINWNNVIQSSAISNDINNKLNAEYGKNLFDKDTLNRKTPCVVYYANGYVSFSPATFSAVVVPIPDGVTQISVNSTDAQISAYNHMVDITAIDGVTTIPGYLGGTTQQGNVGFNLPVGTKCVVVSTLTTQLQGLQVESGAVITGYEPYVRGIRWGKVIGGAAVDDAIASKIGASYSRNLLDKDTSNKKASCVVYYADGTVSFSPDTFSAVVVPIPDGVTQISVNSPDAQIAAFDRVVDVTAVSSGDVISGYLGGSTQQTNVGFNLPVGTKCVVVSCYTASLIYLQVESGSAVTEYKPYVRGINWDDIIQNSAIESNINNKLTAEIGKNLYDKDTTNKKTPCVVYYANGYVSFSPATFSAVVVPIPDGVTQISVNSTDAQISAYNHMVDITAIDDVTTIPGYLGGTTQQGNVGFTLPANTKCIVVSTLTTQLQGLQVESGSAITGYAPYVRGIHWNKIIGAPQPDLRILHVGAGYTYTTIQSAINAASDGDTIIVHEGIYTESVNVYSSNKFLTIRGTSKKDCILTYSNGDYNAPPIMIGKGYVENLSIIATGTTKDPDAPDYAYCAHIDYDNEENSSLTFNNCYFENEWWACVGIGLRKNFTVSFILCDFVSRGAGRAVFCHGAWYSNNINQNLELIDCSIYTIQEGSHGASIYLEEITGYSGNEMTICMQRCIVKNAYGYEPTGKAVYIGKHGTGTGGEGSGGPGYLGSQEWYLHPMSEMNSYPICNYSEQ